MEKQVKDSADAESSTKKPGKPSSTAPEAVDDVMYAKRAKIYPRQVHGLFAGLRTLGVLSLLGLYYGVPWMLWDGRQAVLFDLPARKFYIFGLTFWPQDFFYLALLLVIATLALFFFTALAGRLWCGFACPQTVWTEAFLWMERKIEGDRNKQMKLDKGPMNARKFRIKATKHTAWILFSLFTGFTFVGYFTPIEVLWGSMINFAMGPWETFWVLFYGFATYGNAGWMREQVCIYMCPYARFQSAMFDKNTLIVSYDPERGEPRGSRKKKSDYRASGLGDCVNCTLCKQVCPTGIDIRDGLQYQCIGCAACIDVCDEVMDKMGYEKGLIRYTTENALEHSRTRILRPRIVIYSLLLLVLTGALFYSISQRIPIDLDIIRDRNILYRETREGLVENVYLLKIINMDESVHEYRLEVTGLEGMILNINRDEIVIPSGEVFNLSVNVQVDPVALSRSSSEIDFTVTAIADESITTSQSGRFLGPAIGAR